MLEASEKLSQSVRSPATVRYSDVAHYVSLSLSRDPQQAKTTPKRQSANSTPPGHSVTLTTSPPRSPQEPGRSESLPSIQQNRSDRLRCQLEWLKAEQRAEKEQLQRLEGNLSDSLLLERKAQRRVAKNKVMRDFHQQRVQDVEAQIAELRGEMQVQNMLVHQRSSPRAQAPNRFVEGQVADTTLMPDEPRHEETPFVLRREPDLPVQRPPRELPPLEPEAQEPQQPPQRSVSTENWVEIGRQLSEAGSPSKSKSVPSLQSTTSGSSPWRKKTVTSGPKTIITEEAPPPAAAVATEGDKVADRTNLSTPQPAWMKTYVSSNNYGSGRSARWQPGNPEENIDRLLDAARLRSEGDAKKKWMSATFKRLKNRGKSDARCREIVALHLPRGTGPKDREEVATFSQNEVRACKKAYTDSFMDPVKRIQKVMIDMKDQKRELRVVREDLFMVTEARILAQRAEEDRKNVAASIGGLLGKSKDKDKEPFSSEEAPPLPPPPQVRSFRRLAEDLRMDEEVVSEMFSEYIKLADSAENLGRKSFGRLLQAICPSRTLADSDLDAWWAQIVRSGGKKTLCNFEEFATWYSTSEARAQ